MSTSHAEDIPLPPSQNSPQIDGSISKEEEKSVRAEGVGEAVERNAEPSSESRRDSKAEVDVVVGGSPDVKDVDKNESNGPTAAADTSEDKEAQQTDEKASATEHDDHTAGPANPTPIVRAPTPSSRTSTPPLHATGSSASASKKFTSVSVTKKFLTKAASPAVGTPTATSKLSSFSSSPVPIVPASSRLLSTKLTTVPKSSASPNPPGSAGSAGTPGSAGNSPWAKPAVPLPPVSLASASPIHQPAPTRARVLSNIGSTAAAMGSGQGIGAGNTPKVAWRSVPEGKGQRVGMSRDFPTANEVAEGKRAQQMAEQMAAQAQAAHNQAILQGLNAFTQLDVNTHRWDDEEDDDDVIDFGDGATFTHHPAPVQPPPQDDRPVAKSERFVEDFDRSWPRKAPIAPEPESRTSTNRALFDASGSRADASLGRPQPPPQPQPTRLLSRSDRLSEQSQPGAIPGARTFDRPLPPHLQSAHTDRIHTPPSHPEPRQSNIQPPSRLPPSQQQHPPPVQAALGSRVPWAAQREAQNAPIAPHAERPAAAPASQPPQQNLQRQSFSNASRPDMRGQPPQPAQNQPTHPPGVDPQTAEMSSAAEKARLRRLAEEQEREAAAERARQKAKELEDRLHLKAHGTAASTTVSKESPATSAPPGLANSHPPGPITIVQRPKQNIPPPAPAQASAQTQPKPAVTSPAASLPPKPTADSRVAEKTWRSRPPVEQPEQMPAQVAQPRAPMHGSQDQRAGRPTAESFFDRSAQNASRQAPAMELSPLKEAKPELPVTAEPPAMSPDHNAAVDDPSNRRESNFDDMLARIQAAMAEARVAPTAPLEPSSDAPDFSPPQPAAQPQAQVEQPVPRLPVVVESSITQPQIPKSPPPAWRTYAVRVPKGTAPRPLASEAQAQAATRGSASAPTGWMLSFVPPIEGLSPFTLSRPELLLPQRVTPRFARVNDLGPMVSISPRKLEPFAKAPKKKTPRETTHQADNIQPATTADILLPAAGPVNGGASAKLRSQMSSSQPVDQRWTEKEVAVTQGEPPLSAANAQPTSQPEIPAPSVQPVERVRPAESKPLVRFDESTELKRDLKVELEADSLLDEVNKMSLETVGEATDERRDGADGTGHGVEAPRTPPSNSATSSRGPAVSPLPGSTSWNAQRNVPQHDHLKNVWEPTAARQKEPFASQAPAAGPSEVPTPSYPSLNAPSSADPPASQLLPATSKVGSYVSTHQGYSPSHAYGSNSAVNGNGMSGAYSSQQAVWSPSAFGAGYGYTKPTQTMGHAEQKAAMAFNAAPGNKDAYNSQGINQYRYAQNASIQSSPFNNHYGQTQSPQTTHYPHTHTQQSPYLARPNLPSPQGMYGYNYGAPGQQQQQYQSPGANSIAARGRMDQYANTSSNHHSGGTAAYDMSGIDTSGGYYGGLTQSQAQAQMYGYGATSGNAHGAIGQQQQKGSSINPQAGQRKMW